MFMPLLIFFPEIRREPVLGGRNSPSQNPCISPRRLYNAGAGLRRKHKAAKSGALSSGDCAHLGRQTESGPVSLTPKTSEHSPVENRMGWSFHRFRNRL